jgi:hypothetical protein
VDTITEKMKEKNCFKIITPGRVFVISAPTPEEMEGWIDAIRKVVTAFKKGNPENADEVNY